MESKDDIKNTEKYLDNILLYKALIDQGCSSDKEVQKVSKRKIPPPPSSTTTTAPSPQKQARKNIEGNTGKPKPRRQSKSTGDGTTSLPPSPRKDSQQSVRRGNN